MPAECVGRGNTGRFKPSHIPSHLPPPLILFTAERFRCFFSNFRVITLVLIRRFLSTATDGTQLTDPQKTLGKGGREKERRKQFRPRFGPRSEENETTIFGCYVTCNAIIYSVSSSDEIPFKIEISKPRLVQHTRPLTLVAIPNPQAPVVIYYKHHDSLFVKPQFAMIQKPLILCSAGWLSGCKLQSVCKLHTIEKCVKILHIGV